MAYQIATLDVISGGRVILGVGIGPPKPTECEHEFETLSVPFKKRMFYMQEHMTLMRRLWTEDNVTFRGKYYQVENVTLEPKPIQNPVPMWIASGVVDTAWRRVERFGDGWFPNQVTPGEFAETWGKIREEEQHKAKLIFDRLREEYGFTGGYTIVKDYVRERRLRLREMFVPLTHPPGHAQMDFG